MKKRGEALIKAGRRAETGKLEAKILTWDNKEGTSLIRTGDPLAHQRDFSVPFPRRLLNEDSAGKKRGPGPKHEICPMITFEEAETCMRSQRAFQSSPGLWTIIRPLSTSQSMGSNQRALAELREDDGDRSPSIIVS